MTDDELQAIKARVEAATPGPWAVHDRCEIYAPCPALGAECGEFDPLFERHQAALPHDNCSCFCFGSGTERYFAVRIVETDDGYYPPCVADATFIAHARTDVPALVAEVERLRELLSRENHE